MKEGILHIDGDSFFASCEASLDPKLRGKPVVTGQERGIATAMSKEAKALGIFRGMPVFQIRKLYPEVIIRQSDYLSYCLFAQRVYSIVGRYTEEVEEYSIDECFAHLSGSNLEEVVGKIKHDLQSDLGMTFSLGLAQTKVLAKLASSKNKPDGLTILTKDKVEEFLKNVDVGKVWGIGPSTAGELRKLGIQTAFDLMSKPAEWGREVLHKSTREIWHELNGISVYGVFPSGEVGEEESPKSIQSTRTFTPASLNDKSFIFSELSKNTERACVKIRQNKLAARRIYCFLKTQEFRYQRFEFVPERPLCTPRDILKCIRGSFDSTWRPGVPYRATGITLAGLVPYSHIQNDLFDSRIKEDTWKGVFEIVDKIDRRHGSHTVVLGSSLGAYRGSNHLGTNKRLKILSLGETN
jgi:DNA polymerase IV